MKVECKSADGQLYENTHHGVHNDPQLRAKVGQKHLASGNFFFQWVAYCRNRKQKERRILHFTSDSPGMNVLMFGFDSMSRMTWMRNLPKTYEYFTKHLEGIVLEGYNIVGMRYCGYLLMW